ncbi:alpha/beta hydrolase [Herbaspirillum sp. YR522]|uniref:alpha/beta hydrolase n=1 Tax=Herbaspirillum sp. YR522 TaxID=1144342 RepID=UPI00026F5C09|nr:alpha/beta hydrolase [Herbaspirillum sp. YR522]EJN10205.1 esterase/lipase [Herbaspirillum sp. YR522]
MKTSFKVLCLTTIGAVAASSLCAAAFAADDTSAKPNPVKTAVAKAAGKVRADKEMLAVLDAHASLDPKAIEKADVATARKNPTIADAVNVVLKQQGKSTDPQALVPGVTSKDITVTGAAGSLPATVYTPEGTGPFPVVVYFHGGGWVIADRHVYDGGARGLAKSANAVVVSVDYRQAPENKFPAAWDDALASYRWALANAASIKGDGKRVALAGESAGGNLALATAIAARDAKLQAPSHVLAIYPVTQTSLNTESYIENSVAQPLNRAMVKWFVDHLVRSKDDLKDPRLQLIEAKLDGLPSVTLINARIDPLRSDGAKMEDALKKAGVPVERRDYEGVTHEFFGTAAVVDKARQAQAYAGERLKQAFASGAR